MIKILQVLADYIKLVIAEVWEVVDAALTLVKEVIDVGKVLTKGEK